MVKNHSILFVILVTMSYTFQAQNSIVQSTNDKNAEIAVVSSSKNSDSTNVKSFDTIKVQLSMSQIIIRNEVIESEKKTALNLEKEPRIEMFSKTKDSIEKEENKR